MWKKCFESIVCGSVVEHTTRNLKIKGSEPTTGSGRENAGEKVLKGFELNFLNVDAANKSLDAETMAEKSFPPVFQTGFALRHVL